MKTKRKKTFKVTIDKPSPEEAAKLRKIIKEVKEEQKNIKPEEWVKNEPGEIWKGR